MPVGPAPLSRRSRVAAAQTCNFDCLFSYLTCGNVRQPLSHRAHAPECAAVVAYRSCVRCAV